MEVNERLRDEPELINHEPYSGGWIFKVRLLNRDEVKDLLSYEKYSEKISRE